MNIKEFEKLCDLVYRKTGITIDKKKYDTLSKKIENLMQKKGFKDFRSFFHELRFKDTSLMQDIINLVTVNETYFFRENYQFEALINDVLPKMDKELPNNEVIRILCSPTSTGEEAYSIALHLLDEGNLVEKRDFEIIGIDIDSNVITKAQRGIFSKRSVQFLPQRILSKYFKKLDDNYYEIDKFLRDAITFKVVNVMDKFAMKRLGKFNVIFCRNMLIYFDDKSRKEVAMTFYDMLKPKGYVFLGHAESMSRIVSVFKTVKINNIIAYQKP